MDLDEPPPSVWARVKHIVCIAFPVNDSRLLVRAYTWSTLAMLLMSVVLCLADSSLSLYAWWAVLAVFCPLALYKSIVDMRDLRRAEKLAKEFRDASVEGRWSFDRLTPGLQEEINMSRARRLLNPDR